MRLAAILGGAVGAMLAFAVPAAHAQTAEPDPIPSQKWSFGGAFGTYDLAAAQRGFQVYREVCSNCHAMSLLHYRDLSGIGLTPDEIKSVAASVEVPGGIDDSGQQFNRPGTPADAFRSPFPNDKAAASANGGAIPPDQSLIVNARENGANYIDALLNGYGQAPAGFKVAEGLYYNKYFPGRQLHMPPPLTEDRVTYADGTKATVPQMSHDVVTFLTWAANPEAVTRKQIGVRVVLFLMMMTGLTYAVKRQVWANVH